jgi:serine/threonine-protein kinase
MSPEQAKGRTADKRADIWAFGCVLYEMLTGRRAFDGEDVSEVIAAVIRGEPDWTALPPNTPEQIRLLLKRCLEKDRKARISDIGTARFLMTETIAPASPVSVSSQPAQADRRRSVAIGTAIGLIAGIIIATLAARTILRSTSAPWPKPARFAIGLPPGSLQVLQAADRNLDISADGAFIVYRGAGATQAQLFVRAVNELDARPLSRAVEGRSPFISPDGRWVGFFAGPELKKVLITGGPAITLCRVLSIIRGASWGPDDTIVFADINSGLMSVPASGGEPRVLIKAAADEGNYNFPFVLPGGAVLFSISTPGGLENSQIAVFNPKTGERRVLLGGGTAAQYGGGYLVYGADSTLRAVRFDVDRLAVLSDPVPVVEQVMTANSGAMNFAMSTTGSLVYLPTSAAMPATPRSLVWVTRQGARTANRPAAARVRRPAHFTRRHAGRGRHPGSAKRHVDRRFHTQNVDAPHIRTRVRPGAGVDARRQTPRLGLANRYQHPEYLHAERRRRRTDAAADLERPSAFFDIGHLRRPAADPVGEQSQNDPGHRDARRVGILGRGNTPGRAAHSYKRRRSRRRDLT